MTDELRPDGWWQALRGDPLPWLLNGASPAVLSRALVELLGRPADSAAVVRARGGASADEPVASLLEALQPDGSWLLAGDPWAPGGGAWRTVAAAQLGADPHDPRLAAAVTVLLAAPGHGALGRGPQPCTTARFVAAVVRLGFASHPRVGEALAWLESQAPEGGGGWGCPVPDHATSGGCVVSAVALLGAVAGEVGRRGLPARAGEAVLAALAGGWSERRTCLPRLLGSDAAEAAWALARAGRPYDHRLHGTLVWLQEAQDDAGRWRPTAAPPAGLGLPHGWGAADQPSPDLSLEAVVALAAYAVPAGLPRLFPTRPGSASES